MFAKGIWVVVAILFLAVSPTTVKGETRLTAENEDLSERARLRLYPGGSDEQPIEVQKQIYVPRRDQGESSTGHEGESNDGHE